MAHSYRHTHELMERAIHELLLPDEPVGALHRAFMTLDQIRLEWHPQVPFHDYASAQENWGFIDKLIGLWGSSRNNDDRIKALLADSNQRIEFRRCLVALLEHAARQLYSNR